MKINNVTIKEKYTLKQYKSCKYSIETGNYDRQIPERLIVGDDKFDPTHITTFDSNKISQAYDDALILETDSVYSVLGYVNKYGLPVSDNNYTFLQESANHLQEYIKISKRNLLFHPDKRIPFIKGNHIYRLLWF